MPIKDISSWALGSPEAISGTIALECLSIPIASGIPGCLRRAAGGGMSFALRNPNEWPELVPLTASDIPGMRDKINEIIVAINYIRNLHVS